MAGLGLSDAVDGYLRNKRLTLEDAWTQEQRGRQRSDWAEQDKRKLADREASEAGAAVMRTFQQEASAGLGAPNRYLQQGGTDTSMPNQAGLDAPVLQPKATFQPTPDQLLKGYNARMAAYAKNDQWEPFTTEFAKTVPIRAQMRDEAINKASLAYRTDGDLGRFIKNVYSTVDDGREISDVVPVKGVRDLEDPGKSIPETYTLKFKDGAISQPITAEQALKIVDQIRLDPAKVAEKEFEHSLKAALEATKLANKKVEIEAQGGENRKTEVVKNQGALGLADVNNTASQKRTDTTAKATLGSARIGADSRITAANIGASASRYGADARTNAEKPTKRPSSKDLLGMVEDVFGEMTQGGFGSKRVGNAVTAKIAEGAEAYLAQNPNASVPEAMNAAARVMGIKAPTVQK